MGMNGVLDLKAGHSIPSQADLGRFISRDPIGFDGGLHLFNGHSINPVTFTDPDGLKVQLVGTAQEKALFNDYVSKLGLNELYAGAKADQAFSIKINLTGDSRISIGRAVGLGTFGDLNAHYIDIADIKALYDATEICAGKGAAEALAGAALTHELTEAILEGVLGWQFPFDAQKTLKEEKFSDNAKALFSKTHPASTNTETQYLNSKGYPGRKGTQYGQYCNVKYTEKTQPLGVRVDIGPSPRR